MTKTNFETDSSSTKKIDFKNYQPSLLDLQNLNLKIKTLKNSLKNSEEINKKIIMTSNDAILVADKSFNILFFSEKAMRIFGLLPNERIEGRNFFDFVYKDDKTKLKKIFKRVLKEGFVGNIESKFIKKNENFSGVLNIAQLKNPDNVPYALLITIRDVTKYNEMIKYYEENEELYKVIFNNAKDAIVLHHIAGKNRPGKFFEVNKMACEQLGLEREEILKYTPFDFYANKNDKTHLKNIKRLIKEKHAIFEVPIKRSNGEVIHCEVNSHIIKYKGKEIVLSIIRDITERKEFQEKIRENYIIMQNIVNGVISAMEKLVERKDMYTVGHQRRTAELAKAIAKEMELSDQKIEGIYIAALIHDIGKIFISGSILNKPGKLTKEEYEIIKKHPEEGFNILKSIHFPWPIAEIIYQHHERINGSGYPRRLKDKDILLEAKIIGIADVVEAITFKRPYRKALGINKALEEIIKNKGILYDSQIVDICVKIFKKRKFKFKK